MATKKNETGYITYVTRIDSGNGSEKIINLLIDNGYLVTKIVRKRHHYLNNQVDEKNMEYYDIYERVEE